MYGVKKFGRALGMTFVFAGALSLSAETLAITVSESSDFPGGSSFPGVNVGTLEAGSNSVSGALSGTCVPFDCNGGSAGDTQDSFTFTVAAGSVLNGLFITTSDVAGPAGFTVTFGMRDSSSTVIPTTFLPLDAMSGNLLALPLGEGTYSASIFGQGASEAGAYSLNWSIELNAAPVPEAETYAMILAGLGLVGFMARRRKLIR